MKLKTKSQMTGRELCDLEGYVFPIVSVYGDKTADKKQAFMSLIQDHGESVVKLCYTNNDGTKMETVANAFRFQLLTDMPSILGFVIDMEDEDEDAGKSEAKPTARKIKR